MSKTPEDRPTKEDLLGYLLGALDEAEQESVRRYVAGHPEIQQELGRLQDSLRPLRMVDGPSEPPGGLARRTCHFVFAEGDAWVAPRRHDATIETLARDGWHLWDLTMLMSVAVLMAMLVMPAVYHSRESARRLACASNLRNISNSLRSFSELHGGRFPALPTSGPTAVAGAYSLTLKNCGMLPTDHCVLCPATDSKAFRNPFTIPNQELFAALHGEELCNAQRQLGGSYGYHIGQLINDMLVAAQDLGRNDFAIMSDAPEHGRGLGLVACHPGNGRNVLFESGRVSYVKPVCELTQGIDDLFHNRHCRLAPGADGRDSVVCESGVLIGPLLHLAAECEE